MFSFGRFGRALGRAETERASIAPRAGMMFLLCIARVAKQLVVRPECLSCRLVHCVICVFGEGAMAHILRFPCTNSLPCWKCRTLSAHLDRPMHIWL